MSGKVDVTFYSDNQMGGVVGPQTTTVDENGTVLKWRPVDGVELYHIRYSVSGDGTLWATAEKFYAPTETDDDGNLVYRSSVTAQSWKIYVSPVGRRKKYLFADYPPEESNVKSIFVPYPRKIEVYASGDTETNIAPRLSDEGTLSTVDFPTFSFPNVTTGYGGSVVRWAPVIAADKYDVQFLNAAGVWTTDATGFVPTVFDGNLIVYRSTTEAASWRVCVTETYGAERFARNETAVVGPCWRVVTDVFTQTGDVSCFETPVFAARVVNSETLEALRRIDVESITFSAFTLKRLFSSVNRTPLDGWSNVPVPNAAILDSLVTDERWRVDETGYNFRFEPNARTTRLFPSAGLYSIVVEIVPAVGNSIPLVYELRVG